MTRNTHRRQYNYLGVFLIMTMAICKVNGISDQRPPFDKSPHLKTLWSAANPWWLPNKSRIHGAGGPDFSWYRFSDNGVEMWKQTAERFAKYGLTGLQLEMTVKNTGYVEVYKNILQGFKQAGNGMKVEPFLTSGRMNVDVAKIKYLKIFDKMMPELKNHPNAYRINGCPVVMLYGNLLKPDELSEVIKVVETKYGRIIWLLDAAGAKPGTLEKMLPHIDGISMYGNWSVPTQRKLFHWLAPLMRDKFPQKIFEAGVQSNYTVHFHYGGIRPRLTENLRDSWDISLNAQPDSITLTNWFDCYENSRVMPSYELDDIMLRISQYKMDQWRGKAEAATKKPDFYVSNYTNVLIGEQVAVEVLGFPLRDKDKKVTLSLSLCDDAGKSIYEFPKREIELDSMKAELFQVPALKFIAQRAVHPVLAYDWKGKNHKSSPLPETTLCTSMLPHLLFWSRAINHVIKISGPTNWTLNGASCGQTTIYPSDGIGAIVSEMFSKRSSRKQIDGGGGWVRILRNGREIDSFGNWDLKFTLIESLKNPGSALDWYNLELSNSNGGRFKSLPVWLSSGKRPGKVQIPIPVYDGTVVKVDVEAERVPFFYYPCSRQIGAILLDESGYEHNGFLGGAGYGGGHLSRTAYRFEHIGRVSPTISKKAPRYESDAQGRFLYFDGSNYAMIQGGTAFPYASTYEIFVKPDAIGKEQCVLQAPNGQISLVLLEDGHVTVYRTQAIEGEGGAKPSKYKNVRLTSKNKIDAGRWSHLAVVYDMQEVSLYINGKLEDKAPAAFNRNHEWINCLVVGGGCSFPFIPHPKFKGGIKKIRIYGRNLSPEEFLKP